MGPLQTLATLTITLAGDPTAAGSAPATLERPPRRRQSYSHRGRVARFVTARAGHSR